MSEASWLVPPEHAGSRLDRALAAASGVPRNRVQGWIESGRVHVDGVAILRAGRTLREGEQLRWSVPAAVDSRLVAEEGELSLIHLDDAIIVLDKPPGIAMHPGAGRSTATLAHRLLGRFPEIAGVGGDGRPGIVHRLDRDTSGVVVVARTSRAYEALSRAFADRDVEKRYLAIVQGAPEPREGAIDQPIGRHPVRRQEMAVRPGGRRALTLYRTVAVAMASRRRPAWSLLELDLKTGRTHQIRVHLKHLKHPIAGDETYGRPDSGDVSAPRLALHAAHLAFTHPVEGRRVEFLAPVPEDLASFWRAVSGEELPSLLTERPNPKQREAERV